MPAKRYRVRLTEEERTELRCAGEHSSAGSARRLSTGTDSLLMVTMKSKPEVAPGILMPRLPRP